MTDFENIPWQMLEGLEGQALIQEALRLVGEVDSSVSVELHQLLALRMQVLLQTQIYETLRQIQTEITDMSGAINDLGKR